MKSLNNKKNPIAPCTGASGYKENKISNIKKTKKMQKMSFITKERVYRFMNNCLILMGLGRSLIHFFDKSLVIKFLMDFDIRVDTRGMCDGKFASVVPFIDESGKIRDVWTILYDPQNGAILKDGDKRALYQHTDKQGRNVPYSSCPKGIKQRSLAEELSKGYDFQYDNPTLFGMQRTTECKKIYIFEDVFDAIVIQLLCGKDASCVAVPPNKDLSILSHPNIAKGLRWKKSRIYPKVGSYKKAKEAEYKLSCYGINIQTDSLLEQMELPWKREGMSIATIALNMLDKGFTPQNVISYLGLMDEPF